MHTYLRMRLNIYVPDLLGNRMKKVKGDINWSEVAQRAFEQKLGEVAALKTKPTMKDVIDRLRASKNTVHGSRYTEGHEAGKQWAERLAEYDQLKRLAELRGSVGSDWHPQLHGDAFGLAGAIVRTAVGKDNFDRAASNDFWSDLEIDDPEDFYFCDGFLAGVEAVWQVVEAKL